MLLSSKFGNIEDDATASVEIGSLAFSGATNLKTLNFGELKDVEIAGTATTDGAFYNATKLETITFGASENLNIQTYAFENVASALATANGTLTFGDAKNLQIGEKAFIGAAKLHSVEIATSAFEDAKNLKTLTFGTLKNVEIKKDAFKGATVSLATSIYATATFGDLQNSSIEEYAFSGATKLNTVTIGDITDSQIGSTGTAAVFPAVKTVTIGAVTSTTDATVIAAKAFTFDNVTETILSLAQNKALETVATTNTLIAAGAFDFSAVGTVAKNPEITIGELKTAKVFAAGALKGDKIAKITFDGNIAAGALDVMVVTGNTAVTGLTELKTLVFNGEIATGGIVNGAFKALPAVMKITFNGKLASLAVADGAFEDLIATSQVVYAYNGADIDKTVNPFGKLVFVASTFTPSDQDSDSDVDIDDVDAEKVRDINLSITNDDLRAIFKSVTDGLGTFNGTFAIYRVIYADPVEEDFSFKVYPDLQNNASIAWARWELGHRVDADVTGTLTQGTNLVIKRVQKVDETHNAKITIYGTYTDEDDALNASSIYMIPLKAKDGYYHIPGTNKTTLIVKVENNGGNFTNESYKVKVNESATPAYNQAVCGTTTGSIWPGLENTELYVANNIMTNQQLNDKQATDAASTDATGTYGYFHSARTVADIDIYRGTYGTTNEKVAEDLYIMSNPAKNKGFRIDKTEITRTNDAYINKGWYYMLLKKYEGAPAAARVVWMDDATESDVTAILSVKSDAKNVVNSNAIYTLQGVRVSQMQKGQIYIVNGKKYLAK